MDDTARKPHRTSKSGVKAQRKKESNLKKSGQDESLKGRNPKAFVNANRFAALKAQRRSLDLQQKAVNMPVVDRSGTAVEEPPYVVAVVGPPQVGKSTLIRSLIKNYTRYSVGEIKGPITVIAGKKRRLTFIECNNDLNSMIDTAKVADLVLLLVDASFGFEMETFEFLNVLQTHGFPKVIGVLTHLDAFKNNKRLKKTKKKLKDRFWTEVYQGAKLFYLSGILHGKYPKQEIHNLARFIAVAKFIPLSWRNTHPYVHVDRFEDITEPQLVKHEPTVDRTVCVYGYVRGTYLKPHMKVHIPGSGDYHMKSVTALPDPCPKPDERKRILNGKERLIYSPMSDIGNILYDKDAVYINIPESQLQYSKRIEIEREGLEKEDSDKDDEQDMDEDMDSDQDQYKPGQGIKMVKRLQNTKVSLDEKMQESELQLFTNSKPIKNTKVSEADVEDISDNDYYSDQEEQDDEEDSDGASTFIKSTTKKVESKQMVDGRLRRKVNFMGLKKNPTKGGSDDEDGDQDEDEEEQEDMDSDQEDMMDSDQEEGLEEEEEDINYDDEEDEDEEVDDEDYYDLKNNNKDQDEEEESEEESEEDSDSEDNEENNSGESSKWKEKMTNLALANRSKINTSASLASIIYGDGKKKKEQESDDEELFKVKKGGLFKLKVDDEKASLDQDENTVNRLDSCKNIASIHLTSVFQNDTSINKLLISRFVDKDELATMGAIGQEGDQSDDKVLFGDFEDLETGKKFVSKDNESDSDSDSNSDSDSDSTKEERKEERKKKRRDTLKDRVLGEEGMDDDHESSRSKNKLRKESKIEQINRKYEENEVDFEGEANEAARKQRAINEAEFEKDDMHARMQYLGYPIGIYVRIEFERVPCEFTTNFDPRYPLLVGGLLSNEENLGMVNVQVKKHRWHKRVLKSNDPLVISMGWRRFQTVMLYSIQDINGRNRMLKYTPLHMHCHATFYGPVTPPGTGFIAFTNVKNKQQSFRVSANGHVLDLNQSVSVVKKLKLVGKPSKILNKTAFITGMFNSTLEVAKFMGATIRTVSGVRGQVKKAVREGADGTFRATFEDKLVMSDIVFLRTWYPITPTKFYNPVTNILQRDKVNWEGMKTVGQLRFEKGIRAPHKEDSVYRDIKRSERVFRPLEIPNKLQAALPFDLKPKRRNIITNEADALLSERAVVMEPHESRVQDLMARLEMIKQRKIQKAQNKQAIRVQDHKEKSAKDIKDKESRMKDQLKRKMKLQALKGGGKKKQKF